MVDLPVGAGAVADDGEHVAQLGLAAEGAGVVGQLLDERGGVVFDVHAAGAPLVAEEREHPVALREPPVLGDDLGGRLGGQPAVAVQPHQAPQQRGVEGRDGHRVFDARADVADAHLDGGERQRGADVPPQLAAALDELHVPISVHEPVEVGPGRQRGGEAGARHSPHDRQPVRLEPGLAPAGERRRRRQRVHQRQVAPDRGHHPDALVVVAEAGVDVHAADHEPPQALLERDREPLVALAWRDHLCPPRREGVRRGGHHRRPVFGRRRDHQPARLAQRLAHFGHRPADLRAGFDLRPEELGRRDVRPAVPRALVEDAAVRVGQQVARLRVDEEELFLDAERDAGLRLVHGS